nr:carbohydrate ABC transporter substrate-binding protein [Vulcanisaeta sp.]
FNTPEQWWSYEELVNWSKTPSDWCRFVYQLSDGGVFDDVFAQIDQGLLTYAEVGPSGTSQWMNTLASALAEEKAEWLKANQLGLGYLGWPGYYLGCYEPPWVSGSG